MENSVGMKRRQEPTECMCVESAGAFKGLLDSRLWFQHCRPQLAPWDKEVACLGCFVKGGVKHH